MRSVMPLRLPLRPSNSRGINTLLTSRSRCLPRSLSAGQVTARFSTTTRTKSLQTLPERTQPTQLLEQDEFHRLSSRHVLRGILRECTYFPDEFAASWIRQYALMRFRTYEAKNRKYVTKEDYTKRLETVRRKSRQGLYQMRRANEGDRKMLLKALSMAYGRIGKRRRELLSPLLPANSSSEVEVASSDGLLGDAEYDPSQASPMARQSATQSVGHDRRRGEGLETTAKWNDQLMQPQQETEIENERFEHDVQQHRIERAMRQAKREKQTDVLDMLTHIGGGFLDSDTPTSVEDSLDGAALAPSRDKRSSKGHADVAVKTQVKEFVSGLPLELRTLVQSQITASPPTIARRNPRRLGVEIPELNTWYKPMPAVRVKNRLSKWYASLLSTVQPPLPEREWFRLRDLALGNTRAEPPIPRRAQLTTPPSVLEMTVTRGKLPTELFRKDHAHKITPRFMRRLWADVFSQCPLMEYDAPTSGWKVTWGHHTLQSQNNVSEGIDSGPTSLDKPAG